MCLTRNTKFMSSFFKGYEAMSNITKFSFLMKSEWDDIIPVP